MRIAMVSEHASPLAALGGVDAGGQNVHVAALARAPGPPGPRGRRLHPPGRPRPARARAARPGRHRGPRPRRPARPHAQGRAAAAHGRVRATGWRGDWAAPDAPDVVHAHFWMSGLAALRAGREPRRAGGADVPRARHASSGATRARPTPAPPSGSRSSAGSADRGRPRSSPPAPTRCVELRRMGVPTATACTVVPCGVDTDALHPVRRRPAARRAPAAPGCSPSAGWSSARASTTPSARWRTLPGAELVVAGGPPARRARRRPGGAAAARAGRASSASPTGVVLRRPGAARASCRRCTARPTSCWPCPGTSRSASPRWRRWPAACPSSAPPWAACSTPSTTASPAACVPPRDPGRLAARARGLLADPARAPRDGARAGAARAWQRVRLGRVGGRRRTSRSVLDRHAAAATGRSAARRRRDADRALARRAPGRARRRHGRAWPPGASWSRRWGEQLATTLSRRRPAARRRQRRQRRRGAAPHRRARRPLLRRPPAAVGASRCAPRPRSLTAIAQRLRPRGGVRPAGRGARARGRRAGAAVDERTQPQRAAAAEARRATCGLHGVGDDRARPEPAGRAGRRGARRRRAAAPPPCRRCTSSPSTRCARPSTPRSSAVASCRPARSAGRRSMRARATASSSSATALLDRDVDGHVDRVCPDAPVPVVDVDDGRAPARRRRPRRRCWRPRDGARSRSSRRFADDDDGRELLDAARRRRRARWSRLGHDGRDPASRPRVRAGGQSLLRARRPAARAPARRRSPPDAADGHRRGRRRARLRLRRRRRRPTPALRGARRPGAARRPVVWDPHPRGADARRRVRRW